MRTVEGTGLKRTLHKVKHDIVQAGIALKKVFDHYFWLNCIMIERKWGKSPLYLHLKVKLCKTMKRETQMRVWSVTGLGLIHFFGEGFLCSTSCLFFSFLGSCSGTLISSFLNYWTLLRPTFCTPDCLKKDPRLQFTLVWILLFYSTMPCPKMLHLCLVIPSPLCISCVLLILYQCIQQVWVL